MIKAFLTRGVNQYESVYLSIYVKN